MPFASVTLQPGVSAEWTPTLNQTGYVSTQLGRFVASLFQKLGGWVRWFPIPVSGIPRDLHAWQDQNETSYLAVGATTQLAVITNGTSTITDITPQIKTTNFAPKFSTTNGDGTVTVDDSNISNVTIYDSVFFNTPISVGGIILSGAYPISLITGTTTYEIETGVLATSTVINGGAVPAFTTASGSSLVSVAFNAHGLSIDDDVVFQVSTSVGGVTIFGSYVVVAVGSANAFTISASNNASSNATVSMNSGNAQIAYYIAVGPQSAGVGYGLGTYGTGLYGLGIVPTSQTGTPITSTDWTLDNWGQDLLGCPENGGIYVWSPTGGFSTARLIDTGPIFNTGMFVSTQAQILVAYGSSEDKDLGVDQDALLIRWSDQGDYTVWTESTLNQARRYRIPRGSKIVGGAAASRFDLIWTDLSLWIMEYVGSPYVYTLNPAGEACGLVAKHAQTMFRDTAYWMGKTNFFTYAGGVQVLPCSVWDAVFQDLDQTNLHKIRCGSNTPFNEIWWFYPSASGGTGENDKYVKYNVLDRVWDLGNLGRTAWIDQSVLGNPIASVTNGTIYQHEMGYDGDGTPLSVSFTTGYFYLDDGENFVSIDRWYPDMRYGTYAGSPDAQLQVTFNVVNFPGDTPRTYGPYNFMQTTQYVAVRFRGRQVSLTLTSSDAGSFFRCGKPRFRYNPMGRR